MKVLVLTTRVPFIHGGAEELRDHLVSNLKQRKVDAEAISLPFTWDPAENLIDEMMVARLLEVKNAERVIALKFPAYMIPHHNKTIWLLHQYRQAYDLWDAGQSNIPDDVDGDQVRKAIISADDQAFSDAKAIYTVSPVVSDRLRRYNGFESTPLPAPINDAELFHHEAEEPYIFAGGRVGNAKRQALLIRALPHAPNVRLVIAGPPDRPAEAAELRTLVRELGVEDRVTFDLRFLARKELARLVNRASAVAYIPFDEDSVGYVTMEAFQARKPVITTSDSGGVLEIVRHGESGLVASPDAAAIGAAFATIMDRATNRRALGNRGFELMEARGLNWDATVARLLA